MSKSLVFSAVALAQLALISCLYVEPAWNLGHGRVVTLQTTPVDPHDLFRGEYASLGYDLTTPPKEFKAKSFQTVYAVLSNKHGIWQADRFSTTRPAVAADQVVLAGKTSAYFELDNNSSRSISYGIERLYLQEGKSIQLQNRGGKLHVEVAINNSGRALIKRVLDGKDVLYDGSKILSL